MINFHTKAETLEILINKGFDIPKLYYFTVLQWKKNEPKVLEKIFNNFKSDELIAIRSSSLAEDSYSNSMAGVFHSFLNIKMSKNKIKETINRVISSYKSNDSNQVLIQKMVNNVSMSGVLMTKNLEDGSPYYVINYDDSTGKTDTVTSGNSINKTVYIYNGSFKKDFDSTQIYNLIKTVRKLENNVFKKPLDIEFAIENNGKVNILQLRPITTVKKWNLKINKKVSLRFKHLRNFVNSLMVPRDGLSGKTTLLGIMSDWNPAEMIGVVPKPLSSSLYRDLITKNVWARARESIGYKSLPSETELMVSLFGRVYIDIRNSFNSFLPNSISVQTSNKIINCYIEKLKSNPHLHDKIEFDIAFTCYEFDLYEKIEKRYPQKLDIKEKNELTNSLRSLTIEAINMSNEGSLPKALKLISVLKYKQKQFNNKKYSEPFFYANKISQLLEDCRNFGTFPFSIIARHAFISEIFIRNFFEKKVLSEKRIILFRRSINTIATKMSNDFYMVSKNKMTKKKFLKIYGHIRPGSYDILSKSYNQRPEIFEGNNTKFIKAKTFKLTNNEFNKLKKVLNENELFSVNPNKLINYIRESIIGREYSKYIFTCHTDQILKNIELWGQKIGLSNNDLSMLTINDITKSVFSPLGTGHKEYYSNKIKLENINLSIANSFKLNYLIRSARDINIVPIQRNEPNFIGSSVVEGEIIFVDPHKDNIKDISEKIVLIESADPGYDWLFSKNIKGLITKYGGVNSHMSIRCSELNILAVIGCGEQNFERIKQHEKCIINGSLKSVFSTINYNKIF